MGRTAVYGVGRSQTRRNDFHPVGFRGLIGVVSHWPEFLIIARTMLAAVGVDPDLVVLRDTHRPRWTRGLDQTAAIICDVLTAKKRTLPAGPRPFVFSLLADSARTELQRIVASSRF